MKTEQPVTTSKQWMENIINMAQAKKLCKSAMKMQAMELLIKQSSIHQKCEVMTKEQVCSEYSHDLDKFLYFKQSNNLQPEALILVYKGESFDLD